MRTPVLSFRRKVLLSLALVAATLSAGALLVTLQLSRIRVDAMRVREETRESLQARELLARIRSLEADLGDLAKDGLAVRNLHSELVDMRRQLEGLLGHSSEKDPSRESHQAEEDRLVTELLTDFGSVIDHLHGPLQEETRAELDQVLTRILRFASVLSGEMFEESESAIEDLVDRSRAARGVTLAVGACVLVVFLFFAWMLYRDVVVPILEIRDVALRFGAGATEDRLRIRRPDELGELARTFNEMADRIVEKQQVLEARVEQRTRELIRTSRFADLGILAAGLAHEINNPLASIASCAEGLQKRAARGELDELGDYLQTIASEAWRAKDITSRLLELARPAPRTRGEFELGQLFRHVERMLGTLVEKEGKRFVVEPPEDGIRVGCPGDEMIQVLVNLVRNAMDASPAGSEIRLAGRRRDDRVAIEVQDRGPGIPEEDRARIFDPFYTTKEPGKGTGLGLSVASAIVESHGGSFEVEDRLGGGACFRILLPPAGKEAA
ncbi:MAG: HAMP domain-containing sensor histidine kinase [Planctomycetota bacterium]